MANDVIEKAILLLSGSCLVWAG